MTKKYSTHLFSLCALFVLGNSIISSSVYNLSILGLFVSFGISFLLLVLSYLVFKFFKKQKIIFQIFLFTLCATAIWGAVSAFAEYVVFLNSNQMPLTGIYLLSVVLIGVVIFMCTCSISSIYKYCLFSAVICGLVIIVCFIGGVKNYDFSVIKTPFQKHTLALTDFLPIIILPIFPKFKSQSFKGVFLGTLSAFSAITVCFFQTLLTLGSVKNVDYPYLKAVSVISSGSLFTRLDGLVYFLFFVTSVVKMAVCIKAIILTTKYLSSK